MPLFPPNVLGQGPGPVRQMPSAPLDLRGIDPAQLHAMARNSPSPVPQMPMPAMSAADQGWRGSPGIGAGLDQWLGGGRGSPQQPGMGLGAGLDQQQLAMMLMGAGSGMGAAAGPSPYKTGLGTAMGGGLGGAMSGLMAHEAAQQEQKRQAMLDQILSGQMGAAGQQPNQGMSFGAPAPTMNQHGLYDALIRMMAR